MATKTDKITIDIVTASRILSACKEFEHVMPEGTDDLRKFAVIFEGMVGPRRGTGAELTIEA